MTSKVKSFLTKLLLVSFILGLAYGFGTFKPNPYVVKKIQKEEDLKMVQLAKEFGLHEPDYTYKNNAEFVLATNKCIDYLNWTTASDQRIPRDILVAMAVVESAYGTSRFAKQANNLFGIRTWDKDEPYLLPIPWTKWPGWGVKMYSSKCESVVDYLHILNNVHAFEELREARANGVNDALELANYLDKYASKPTYVELVKEIIQYNINIDIIQCKCNINKIYV